MRLIEGFAPQTEIPALGPKRGASLRIEDAFVDPISGKP